MKMILPPPEKISLKNELSLKRSLQGAAGKKGREFSSELKMLAIKALNVKIVRLRKEIEDKLKQVALLEVKRKLLNSKL